MTALAWAKLALYLASLLALARPLGAYMARVYSRERTPLDRLLAPLERLLYRVCGAAPESSMSWKTYAVAMLRFLAVRLIAGYGLQRALAHLPHNPQGQASSPTPTGRATAARPRSATWCRCSA